MANEKESEKIPVKSEDRPSGLLQSPWEHLAHFREEMDRLFDDFTSGWSWGTSRRQRHGLMEPLGGLMGPIRRGAFGWSAGMTAVDVIDKEKEIQVRAELPGMEEDDIDIHLSNGFLTIHGEKKEERQDDKEKGNYYVSERRYGSFQRSFPIPNGIDAEKVDATFKNGVLTVSLPKTKEAQENVKKIPIKSEK